MTRRLPLLAAALLLGSAAVPPPSIDPDTAAWWRTTAFLSSDAMEGRDTGSPAFERAAKYVAQRFAHAGLKPAGDGGSWFQRVNLTEVRVDKAGTAFRIARGDGNSEPLAFLHQITIRPTDALARSLDAPLVFRGYCSRAEMRDVRGKIAVCFNIRRTASEGAGRRSPKARPG